MLLCPICSSNAMLFSEYRGVNAADSLLKKIFAGKKTLYCNNCRHCFCESGVDAGLLKSYYQLNFWDKPKSLKDHFKIRSTKLYFIARDILKKRIKSPRVDLIKNHIDKMGGDGWIKNGKVLEIGAGQADISIGLSKYHRSTFHVVEPSNEFLYLYKAYGIKKISDTFEDMQETDSYAVVASAHWLEHVININEAILKIKRLLKNNGILFIEVPNCEDPYFKYRYFPNPAHLHFFTPKSLRCLIEKHNFKVVFSMTCGKPVEWEKNIGYLKPDTPVCINSVEMKTLEMEREKNYKNLLNQLPDETKEGHRSDGWLQDAYSESGREFIRIIGINEGER